MDLEQLEALIDEYIAQVPDDDGDEWYGPYRDFARSVLKQNTDEPPYEAFEPFLEWLKRRLK